MKKLLIQQSKYDSNNSNNNHKLYIDPLRVGRILLEGNDLSISWIKNYLCLLKEIVSQDRDIFFRLNRRPSIGKDLSGLVNCCN